MQQRELLSLGCSHVFSFTFCALLFITWMPTCNPFRLPESACPRATTPSSLRRAPQRVQSETIGIWLNWGGGWIFNIGQRGRLLLEAGSKTTGSLQCDFYNLYFAIQALSQYIGVTILTKHKSFCPYETPSSSYLSFPSGSLYQYLSNYYQEWFYSL